jgi:putative redox protein
MLKYQQLAQSKRMAKMTVGSTRVTVEESGTGTYTQTINASGHVLVADEPKSVGGLDEGPAPYSLLLAALGTCTSMTLRMYANQKKWPLEKVSVSLTHEKQKEPGGKLVDVIHREIDVQGPLDAEQRKRLHEIADKCPIHRTLQNPPTILTMMKEPDAPAAAPVAPPPPAPPRPPQM